MNQLVKDNDSEIVSAFRNFIQETRFPCVGAKSALMHGQIEFFVSRDINRPDKDREIVERLQKFSQKHDRSTVFVSFIIIFKGLGLISEPEFEKFLWERLQAFHKVDCKTYQWDTDVSSDPEASDFSMSIGGRAFYVIGLHPNSSRKARQFRYPALVFNLHSQFERLRSDGRYMHIRETIIDRDIAFSGSANPMLAAFGEISEARQYSGRVVSEAWKCPFNAEEQSQSHAK